MGLRQYVEIEGESEGVTGPKESDGTEEERHG